MAEHAKTVTTDEATSIITIDETIDAENTPTAPGTIARTIVFALAWINQLFAFNGLPVLDFDPNDAYVAVSSTITLFASVWGFWKNNSFTIAAKAGDLIMGLVRKAGE